jgi:uncharacterized protein (DUF4415 family)
MATNRQRGGTDLARVKRLTDFDIRRAVANDPDAAPIASAEWMRQAKILEPKPKAAVSIRLDKDVIEWFKEHGRGYQTRINAVLRAYIETHR